MSFQNRVLLEFNDVTGTVRHWKTPRVVDVIDLSEADIQVPTFEEAHTTKKPIGSSNSVNRSIDLEDPGDCFHLDFDATDIGVTTPVSSEEADIQAIGQSDCDSHTSEVQKQPNSVVNSCISVTQNVWSCNFL